ncbi:outer membrane homotrimeric porin [Desulfocurvus sp. DL9XJH121]
MKRFIIVALAWCVLFGAGMANAKEMNFTSQFWQSLEWSNSSGLADSNHKGDSEDDFQAAQRVRMYFEYIDSKDLRGVVGFEIDSTWGSPANGGALGTDGVTVEVKHAYTDFKLAGADVRVGLQPLSFPSCAFGTPLWDDDVAGIAASYQFSDMVGLTVAWSRLIDLNASDTGSASRNDEYDLFTVMLPLAGQGWACTPYAIYGAEGAYQTLRGTINPYHSTGTQDTEIYWAGGAFKLDAFDPFVLGLDLIYGSAQHGCAEDRDRTGWFAALDLDYKLDSVTPALIAFYGSGDNANAADGSEAMPTMTDFTNGDGGFESFAPSRTGFNGSYAGTSDRVLCNKYNNYGMWGLGIAFKDFSFVRNLTQTFTVIYGQGTNDADLVKNHSELRSNTFTGFTDKDSYWDVELHSEYALYENLTLWSELAFIRADLDEETWEGKDIGLGGVTTFTKCCLGIKYTF